jgi:hypothetical protein
MQNKEHRHGVEGGGGADEEGCRLTCWTIGSAGTTCSEEWVSYDNHDIFSISQSPSNQNGLIRRFT